MKTYKEILNWAEDYIENKNLEVEAAKIIVMHFSNLESWKLISNLNEFCDVEVERNIIQAIKKYVDDLIPVQHILGKETFFGYEFFVNEDVLIPRFETEELVLKVLETYDDFFVDKNDIKLVDIGTGSGAIAITLNLEENKFDVYASDISEKALLIAKKNNENLNANVKFLQGNMLDPFINKNMKFDILVSNPPYIPNEEYVEPIVVNNEPKIALFGGHDGLYFYEEILKNASKILNDNNFIAFEHAYDKAEEIQKIAKKYFPKSNIKTFKDLQGKDRITVIKNEVL